MSISVALPVKNGQNFIKEALESLIVQGRELEEIVVADNCSTDDTYAIAAAFAARDSRVRIEKSEVPLDQAHNVSRSIILCQGKWVQILCHDDLILPGAIAQLSEIVSSPAISDCAFIAHRPAHLFSDGNAHLIMPTSSKVEIARSVLCRNVPASPFFTVCPAESALADAMRRGTMPYLPSLTTAAVNRKIFEGVGGFDSRWVHFDIFLWIQLMAKRPCVLVDANWTLTRVHSAQVAVVSRRNQRSYQDFRDFFGTLIPESEKKYDLSLYAVTRLRLKPFSQASAPLVVALRKRQPAEFWRALFALPWKIWALVIALTALNYYKEWRKNSTLWRSVSPNITYE